MRRILLGLGGLSAAATLAFLPATGAAHGGDPDDMMAGLAMSMRHPMLMTARSKAARLTIVHVTRGCHVWSDGERTAPGVKLVARRGTSLRVANMDIDTHRFVRVGGPRVALGRPLKMSDQFTLRFVKAGVYRLMTNKVEGDGMMEAKTTGKDNVLGLTVIVR